MTELVGRPGQEARPGWWRRNGMWLALLPVAVVVAAVASSFRIWAWWWPDGLHHEVDHAAVGEIAHFVGDYYDSGYYAPERAETWVRREVDVSVTSVEQVDELPDHSYLGPIPVPDGSAAQLVHLHLAAELRTDLSVCQIVLVAADGTRYGENTTDVLGGSNRCAPPDAENPISTEPAWDVTSHVLVDEGTEITEVRVGFGGPHYVTIDLA